MKLNIIEFSPIYRANSVICDDGEGLRWKFRYDRWKHDRRPDVLLLGAYRNSNTGNYLVGGINLHYLNKDQLNELARALPKIMAKDNIHDRYIIGETLVPDVFDNYYRTYDAKYIRGVEKDVMYPKYGFVGAVKKMIKHRLSSKAQREKDAEPELPDDIEAARDKLDQIVATLQQRKEKTPEVVAAKRAKPDTSQAEYEKQISEPVEEPDVDHEADLVKSRLETQQELEPKKEPELEPENREPEVTPELDTTEQEPDQDELEESIHSTYDSIEFIEYYSPVHNMVIMEPVNISVQ